MTDTLFTTIQSLFNANKWTCIQSRNKVCFNSTLNPYDEYVLEIDDDAYANVTIPVNRVAYKNSFLAPFDDLITYMKMHVDIYESKKNINIIY